MRRILIIVLVLMLVLVGCSTNNEASDNEMNNMNENVNEMNEKNDMDEENNAMNNEDKNEMKDDESDDMDLPVFDKESLAKYNGEDGMKAYVAVDGVVYDVTDVKAWQTPHAGRFKPGKDYSKEINQSPHGKKNLEGLEVVGTYEE
jgi:predicted heme/steroid binding protein